MENNLIEIIETYSEIIKQFKKRSTVISGMGLGWKGSKGFSKFEDTPVGIGSATGTTGWCVSASEALLYDDVFQTLITFRNAKAKLVSIDIKEQYYGECYNGSQNKWHTAILVEDSNFKFIVDITCRQFGNDFIEKDIWDFTTWCNKLRSPLCKHVLTDFDNNLYNISPVNVKNKNVLDNALITNNLKSINNLEDTERLLLTDFATNRVNDLNERLMLKNMSNEAFTYIKDITNLLINLPYNTIKEGYSVLEFETKQAALNWIEFFMNNDSKLPIYLFVSEKLSDNCKINGVDKDDLFKSNTLKLLSEKTFIIFEFKNLFGIDTKWFTNSNILIPHGIKLYIQKDNIFNSGKLINESTEIKSTYYDKIMSFTNEVNGEERKTNTIIIRVDEM